MSSIKWLKVYSRHHTVNHTVVSEFVSGEGGGLKSLTPPSVFQHSSDGFRNFPQKHGTGFFYVKLCANGKHILLKVCQQIFYEV